MSGSTPEDQTRQGSTGGGQPAPDARAAQRTAIQDRRRRISKLHLARVPQSEIARELSVSEALVSRDLGKIREAWQKEYAHDENKLKWRESAAYDVDERRAIARLVSLPDGDHKNFCKLMDVVLKIRAQRARLWGLDAPVKIESANAHALKVEFVNDWTPSGQVDVIEAQATVSPPEPPANGTNGNGNGEHPKESQ